METMTSSKPVLNDFDSAEKMSTKSFVLRDFDSSEKTSTKSFLLRDFDSGGKKGLALHQQPSMTISEVSLPVEQPFEDQIMEELAFEVPCKALNESMTEALSVTPGMAKMSTLEI